MDKLFPETYKNPNGCPIHGTFYVSHQYTNYAMVQALCAKFCICLMNSPLYCVLRSQELYD